VVVRSNICINAQGEKLPNIFIFKGKKRKYNYLSKTGDKNDTMTMQPKAWVTHLLFKEWISHFITNVRRKYEIAPTTRHLLILDDHTSHVTLEVVRIAMLSGVDLLTFPSHTSHALQPLDVSCFKPFKVAFRAYRDKWTVEHVGQVPSKDDLASWVAFALRKGLTPENITKGFETTGIYPLNVRAMDNKVGLSLTYQRGRVEKSCDFDNGPEVDFEVEEEEGGLQPWQIQEIYEDMTSLPECQHYYVDLGNESDNDKRNGASEENGAKDK